MRMMILLLMLSLTVRGASYYLTVAGLGGDSDYQTQFQHWSGDLDHQFRLNGSEAHVETISGTGATRKHIAEVLARLANEITQDDSFTLLLIGHGSFDGSDYKFNVPGPDITGPDLRDWLSHIKAGRQLVVNMSSCSGASMSALAAKNRIVITATKSGNEKNATVFPRYFVDAFHDTAADSDKDGVISALEAYKYTQQKVSAYFVEEKLIASEHSQFSDNGSENAVRDPGPQNHQGLLAGAFPLLSPPADSTQAALNPAKQKLIKHKDELEARIDRLKYEKTSLAEADYKQQLSVLLLDLAKTQAELDK